MHNSYYQLPRISPQNGASRDPPDSDEEQYMIDSIESTITGFPSEAFHVQRWRHARTTLRWVTNLVSFLLPSFINGPEAVQKTSKKTHMNQSFTSSLDGLRGYAAFAVMNYHIFYAYLAIVFYGYGVSHETLASSCAHSSEDEQLNTRWLILLPIVRLPFSGTWAISVFFVISGFALSYKPLKESRDSAQGFTKGTAAMASSLLRRPFRLFGPPIIATFITMLAVQLGAFESAREISKSPTWVPVTNERFATRLPSFVSQLRDWAHQAWRMFFVFWWGDIHNHYDVHLWTIPTEFRCSLAVFLFLPMYITVQPWIRRPLAAVIIIYVYAQDRWDVALFYAGILIADTSIDWRANCEKNIHRKLSHRAIWAFPPFVLLGLSLYLLSAPDFCASQTSGFKTLSLLQPSSDPAPFRFLPNLGGIILVALVSHTLPSNILVGTILNGPLPQYLGRISYSLYIVHGPLIHSIGYPLFKMFWTITGVEQIWRYVVGFLAAYCVLVMVVICVADIFWRSVDVPCVQLARRIETLITIAK